MNLKTLQICAVMIFSTASSFSQATKAKLQSGIRLNPANQLIINEGYQCENGWKLDKGDTLQLGKGTLPNHAYAYIYQAPTSFMRTYVTGNDAMNGQHSLKSGEASRAIIKRMQVIGTKKGGFTGIAVVGVGGLSRYFIEIDNAVECGELIPPAKFQVNKEGIETPTGESLVDKLKKWKDLLDAGAITQEEYDKQKKKLLGE